MQADKTPLRRDDDDDDDDDDDNNLTDIYEALLGIRLWTERETMRM